MSVAPESTLLKWFFVPDGLDKIKVHMKIIEKNKVFLPIKQFLQKIARFSMYIIIECFVCCLVNLIYIENGLNFELFTILDWNLDVKLNYVYLKQCFVSSLEF